MDLLVWLDTSIVQIDAVADEHVDIVFKCKYAKLDEPFPTKQ